MMSYEGVYEFYRDRLSACPSYGFKAGYDMLRLILRCVFNDSFLTPGEFDSIIKLAAQAYIKMMEDNYNAGWQSENQ